MNTSVAVVDYGLGNLFSVSRALESIGADVTVTDSPAAVARASRLVLPGVGAFSDGMNGLHERKLLDAVRRYGASGRPLLGICLGMQLLFDASEEFGHHEGLGLIPGRVISIPPTGEDGEPHKIPHIGWNELVMPASLSSWRQTVLADVPPRASVYFVHSFTADPTDTNDRLADCYYDGRLISAAVRRNALSGCQFHPEKSGEVGLRILRAFLAHPAESPTSQ
jgi:glutamine amidotransferase